MVSKELLNLLLQVVRSWQVIAVTVAVVVYISLISYVARTHHRPRMVSRSKPQQKKAEAAAPSAGPPEAADGGSTNEELGLEEA